MAIPTECLQQARLSLVEQNQADFLSLIHLALQNAYSQTQILTYLPQKQQSQT